MKYVITGGAGNISKPVVEKLLASGHKVVVVTRNASHISELTALGAEAAVGSLEDVDFLTRAFAGADAVYTMVPPNSTATDWKGYIGQIGANYAHAIKVNGIKYVVNLSSVGAHLAEGCGPVSGLNRVEKSLNALDDVNILHLRPAYFYPNLLSQVDMVKKAGIMGSNFGGPDLKVVFTDPADIALVVADALLSKDFSGHSVRYIASDEKTSVEVAAIIGAVIGKPDLQWIVFSDDDALKGALAAGLPEEVASNYIEMNHAMNTGKMLEDYWENRPLSLGHTKLKDFANIFAAAFKQDTKAVAHG